MDLNRDDESMTFELFKAHKLFKIHSQTSLLSYDQKKWGSADMETVGQFKSLVVQASKKWLIRFMHLDCPKLCYIIISALSHSGSVGLYEDNDKCSSKSYLYWVMCHNSTELYVLRDFRKLKILESDSGPGELTLSKLKRGKHQVSLKKKCSCSQVHCSYWLSASMLHLPSWKLFNSRQEIPLGYCYFYEDLHCQISFLCENTYKYS